MQGRLPERVPNSGLIKGNQEDIDLVIASGEHLIMIEAKAYGEWERGQMKSKLERLQLLHDFYRTLKNESPRAVRFCLLLLSPRRPQKLNLDCPEWAREEAVHSTEVPWMELRLGAPTGSILEVTRCDENGDRAADRGFWRCVECSSSKAFAV
jgi:hypothetical protein